MSAVEDRLAAIIAEHRPEGRGCTGCEWRWAQRPGGASVTSELLARDRAHAAHVAEVIASADDLAVIELPAPSESTERHVAYGDIRRQGGWPATLDRRSGTVYFEDTDSGDSRNLRAKTAVKYAVNILAAARAAEAVSDR